MSVGQQVIGSVGDLSNYITHRTTSQLTSDKEDKGSPGILALKLDGLWLRQQGIGVQEPKPPAGIVRFELPVFLTEIARPNDLLGIDVR